MLTDKIRKDFIAILEEEMIPAMGCTEPISLAYAAAKAREILGKDPEFIKVCASGNMIKNVRCVRIPNSGGLTGIEVAVCLGAMGGDAERGMKVLETVTEDTRKTIKDFINSGHCDVDYLDSDIPLHFIVEETAGPDYVSVEIRHDHTNISKIMRNGEVIFLGDESLTAGQAADRSGLSIDNIKEFADTVDVSEIKDLLDQEIRCNMDIAYEGMAGDYGLGIGRVIKTSYPESTLTRMKAYASAASEARMEGCDMPVIINSGSGNQGIASSVPVIVYARENYVPQEKLYRALVFSGLLTVHQKEYIGKLSAFCGAVSASCAAGAAITYLAGGTIEQIKDTVENTLANIPGIICDGAKASCAAKIATSLDASMMAHYLAMQGKGYQAFTGILKGETDQTISTVGYIGKVGMHETDREIIQTMLE